MKNLQKGRLNALFWGAVLFGISLLSCKETAPPTLPGERNFTKAEDVRDLDSLIMKHIHHEMNVIEISFIKSDNDNATFSDSKGIVQIHYVDPKNTKKKKVLAIDLKTGDANEDVWYNEQEHFEEYKGVKPATLGCTKIADNINTAISMMASDSLDYSGIGSYDIQFGSEPSNIRHKFKIEVQTGSGHRKVIYDEYSFIADLNGNVQPSK